MRDFLFTVSLALFLPFICLGSMLQMDSALMDSLYTQGRAHFEDSNYSLALPYYLQIDSLAKKHYIINPTSINAILDRSEISRVTFTYEGVEMAYDLQKEALLLAKQINNTDLIHNIYVRLADMHGLIDNNDSMKYYLNRAFGYFRDRDDVKLLTRLYLLYMTYFYEVEEFDSAEFKLAEGLNYLRTKDDPRQLGQLLMHYGRHFSYELNDCDTGLPYLLEALETFQNHGDTLNIRYIFLNEELGICFAQSEKYEQAYERFREAFYKKYELERKENKDLTRALETKYQAREREKEVELLTAQNALSEQENITQRWLFIGLLLVLLIVAAVIYVLYHNRQKTNNKLRELDRLKSNFFANISHEFRTPLTLIKGPVEKLMVQYEQEQEVYKNATLIDRNANRLLGLVDQLLDLSKLEANGMPLRVSSGDLIAELKALVESFEFSATEQEIDYIAALKKTDDQTWFDKNVVDKIVLNLLSNAVKYTPSYGKINIDGEVVNGKLHLTVRNTGEGLDTEQIKKITQRFYQADVAKEGVGIGLALVNELVTLHKGQLNYVSKKGEYTEFKISMPVSRSDFDKTEITGHVIGTMASDVTGANGISLTSDPEITVDSDSPILLIVEDNADVRQLVRSNFSDAYQILEAENGEQGIEKALASIPDVIISDVMMPLKDGLALTETLKTDERTSHIPIVLLTAKAGDENAMSGLEIGADAYVTKPFNQELLKVRVQKLIETRAVLRKRYSQEVVLRPKDIAISSTDEKFLGRVQMLLDSQLAESTFNAEGFSKEMGMS